MASSKKQQKLVIKIYDPDGSHQHVCLFVANDMTVADLREEISEDFSPGFIYVFQYYDSDPCIEDYVEIKPSYESFQLASDLVNQQLCVRPALSKKQNKDTEGTPFAVPVGREEEEPPKKKSPAKFYNKVSKAISKKQRSKEDKKEPSNSGDERKNASKRMRGSATEGAASAAATPPSKLEIYRGPPDDDLSEYGGWPPGWIKTIVKRANSKKNRDNYWYSPDGEKFRSLVQVKKALGQVEGERKVPAKKIPRTAIRSRTKKSYPAWAEIDQKDIVRVTKEMLASLRNMDEEHKIFDICGVDNEAEYVQVISKPMDFTTIEDDRVHRYSSITELQQDLILTFKNCIRFHGAMSEYGQLAQTMLDMLNDVYQNIAGRPADQEGTREVKL